MKKWFRPLVKIELVLIYLVILAGSIVRMTGSGMGCPDWPKCFGYLIPPTERAQLEWQPNREFQHGQIIIVNESLRVAKSDFTTENQYVAENWAAYTKHDYALFNPAHTWVEYLNRLMGALAGIPMFLLFVLSLFYIKKYVRYFILSALGLFLLGFEAWLGKLVVDGNLIPNSITIHMLGALCIVVVLLVFLFILNKESSYQNIVSKKFKNILVLTLILSLIQIIIGTQVREQIDHLNEAGIARDSWIENLDWEFYLHRTFSLLILGLNVWLFIKNRRENYQIHEMNWIVGIIGVEILLGVVLNYFEMPKFAQPAHLLLATFLFGFQFSAVLKANFTPHTKYPSRETNPANPPAVSRS